MRACLDPFSFLVVSVAGWMNQHQQHVIEYLIEENRVLREQIGNRRMRFTNSQRCRLAAKARKLSRKTLEHVATIVTPATLLAWHRKVDCPEVRRQRLPYTGTSADGDGDRRARCPFRYGNQTWGYLRVQGAVANLGHKLARNTIANILKRHGIEPLHGVLYEESTGWKPNRVLANHSGLFLIIKRMFLHHHDDGFSWLSSLLRSLTPGASATLGCFLSTC